MNAMLMIFNFFFWRRQLSIFILNLYKQNIQIFLLFYFSQHKHTIPPPSFNLNMEKLSQPSPSNMLKFQSIWFHLNFDFSFSQKQKENLFIFRVFPKSVIFLLSFDIVLLITSTCDMICVTIKIRIFHNLTDGK